VIAAVLSALTGLSYAELAGMFPSAGAEYAFTRHAFNGSRHLGLDEHIEPGQRRGVETAIRPSIYGWKPQM